MTTQLVVLIIIGLSFIGAAGDYLLKLAGQGTKFVDVKWFIIGTLVYASTAIGWFFVLKYIKLGTLGTVYAVSTVLFLVLGGVLFFHEKYTVPEYIGIGLGIASILLLSRFA